MKKLTKALLLASACTSFATIAAPSNISVTYLKPTNGDEKSSMELVKKSQVNQLVLELGDKLFPFNNPLTIEYGSDDGPLFNPESNTIQMPYGFMLEANHYFTKNKYNERYGKPAQDGVVDTVLHTLLHEIGHAYVADKQIPVLGKEEDAVDNLAAIVMLEYIDNGADRTISAADMFAFESEDLPSDIQAAEYIDEHSFNLQRYFQTLCLVYGSNPDQYPDLLDEIGKDGLERRKEFCQYNYQITSDNWHYYLGAAAN